MKIKKKVSAILLTMICIVTLATVAVSAATYSKTKSQNVVAGPCSATYGVTATYNTAGNTRWTSNFKITNIKNAGGYGIQAKDLKSTYSDKTYNVDIKYNAKNYNNYSETALQNARFNFTRNGSSVQ